MLSGALQLRTQAEDPRWSHALQIHLQNLDIRAGSIHPQSDQPDAGTEHLSHYVCEKFVSPYLAMISLDETCVLRDRP